MEAAGGMSNMKCVLRRTLSMAVLTAALARSASADDDADRTAKLQQKVKDLESENASLKLIIGLIDIEGVSGDCG